MEGVGYIDASGKRGQQVASRTVLKDSTIDALIILGDSIYSKRNSTFTFVTYTLPPSNPPNIQTLPTVSTTKDLRIVLNTRLSAEDNVVSAAN